jgi:predicted adenine nucleotide alpha hydrolase (AANH) superfamily ATPase
LECLCPDYEVTVFFYNPNISEGEEDRKGRDEVGRLGDIMRVGFREGDYEGVAESWLVDIMNSPDEPPPFREGGPRCLVCYEQRLTETARVASAEGFDYFATTLTVSPHKNAAKINEIGSGLTSSAVYLPSDFKKRGGYQRSIELSKQYGLYRQRYCGCEMSRAGN